MITEQDVHRILCEQRDRERIELLRERVWERASRVSWWDRHGEAMLWMVCIGLVLAAVWELTT